MTRILLALSTLAVIVVTWILLTPGDERTNSETWPESSKGTASSIPEHEAALGRDSVSVKDASTFSPTFERRVGLMLLLSK